MADRYPIANTGGASGPIPDSPDDIGAAPAEHTHEQGDVDGLAAALSGKADAGHDHDSDYAAAGHDHDGDYAVVGHTHSLDISDIAGLQSALEALDQRLTALETEES